MDLVQLLGQLLAKRDSQEGLAFEVLLVVLGGVVTQVDVHCITGRRAWLLLVSRWTILPLRLFHHMCASRI